MRNGTDKNDKHSTRQNNNAKRPVNPQVVAAFVTAIASLLVALVAGGFALATRPADAVKESKIATTDLENKINLLRDSEQFPFVPPGTILPYGGANLDRLKSFGWILCDGKDYPTNEYPRLFEAIGYSWGRGDNSRDHFRVPDLQGYFLRGVDPNGRTDPGVTNRFALHGGNATNRVGSYQSDDVGPHTHISDSMTKTDRFDANENTPGKYIHKGLDPTTCSTSLGEGKETRPKNAYVYYIIKY